MPHCYFPLGWLFVAIRHGGSSRVSPLCDRGICIYHDQGPIPLKALACDVAVNTTLGLPIMQTSVEHETAFGIVWQAKVRVLSEGIGFAQTASIRGAGVS